MNRKYRTQLGIFILLLTGFRGVAFAAAADGKAREVIDSAIDAMGGDNYRGIRSAVATGRYFVFNKGRKAFSRYQDWTVYDPIQYRIQFGEGDRQEIYVYNMELEKAWRQEGKTTVEELPQEQIADFREGALKDVDVIFRNRLDEEGLSLFYYGPNDIAGQGNYEAVEVLDAANNSVIIFFDVKTRLPAKTESHFTDKAGLRHKEEYQFYNWHRIDGVHSPLSVERYVDDEMSTQRFIETISYNSPIPSEMFREPVPEKKKK